MVIRLVLIGLLLVNDLNAATDLNQETCSEFELPEIDINQYRNGNIDEKKQVVDLLDVSFRDIGVIKLINHGISTETVRRAYDAGLDFFHSPIDHKMRYRLKDVAKSGYTPMGASRVNAENYTDDVNRREDYDLSEFFYFQLKQMEYNNMKIDVPIDGNDSMMHQKLWLSSYPYILDLGTLRKTVHEIVGNALKLENVDYFENDMIQTPDLYYPLFTYLYYPISTNNDIQKDRIRFSAHTDVMTFTYVMNDNVKGLQLFIDNEWKFVKVNDDDNGILLFCGDAIVVYTNDYWKSIKHRVVFGDDDTYKERMTMSYFTGPDYDKRIKTLDCAKCNAKEPKYDARTVEEHFRKRFDSVVDTE